MNHLFFLIPMDGIFTFMLFWCTLSDLQKREIPNAVIILMLALGLLHMLFSILLGTSWVEYPLGALLAALLLIAWHKGSIGGGDVKLLSAIGLYLGLPRMLLAVCGMAVACIFTLLWSLLRNRSLKTAIPLAPVLSAGALLPIAIYYLI